MSDPAGIPEGYELVQRTQGPHFSGLAGPFYAKREGRELSLGLRVEQRHLNSRGSCHGGLLGTRADNAPGHARGGANQGGPSRNFVTLDPAIDNLAATRARGSLYSQANGAPRGHRP